MGSATAAGSQPEPPAAASARSWAVALAPPLVFAAVLRALGLRQQILASDELHTVNGALSWELGQILTTWTYHGADYCVPLTAGFRLFGELGGTLSELALRAPSLCAGLISVVAVPRALAGRIGPRGALLLAWLIAISPLLVWYSRIVRSYMPMILLGFGAVMCFERWWRTRERAVGVASGALGALAIYFHLGAGPFVAAPFVYALGRMARHPAERAELPRLLALGAGLALTVGLLLLPALASLRELMGLHGDGGVPSARDWLEVAMLQAGTASPVPLAALGIAVLQGARVLIRREPDFAVFVATLAVVQAVGLFVLAPSYLEHPLVAARYLLLLLPFLLALAALGLSAPRGGRLQRGQGLVAAGLVVALFVSGPLPGRLNRTWAFQHSNEALRFTSPGNQAPTGAVPAFYLELAQRPGAELVLEFPWVNVGSRSLDAYQQQHGHPVIVSGASRILAEQGTGLRNMVPPDPAAFLASPARWLVVHLDVQREEARIVTSDPRNWQRLTQLDDFWRRLRNAGRAMSRRLEAAWGPPDMADDDIRVWNLTRVRADAEAAEGL